ncbi:MAG TPA: hypothetical protein VKA87_00545, partial [Nitrososphaeraceae archaeon]|nr:hypothetical protein [Nitrososphaeraceae archaeon]
MGIIEGYIRDSNDIPLKFVPVDVFRRLPMGDLILIAPPAVITGPDGHFEIPLSQDIPIKNSQIYLAITDSTGRFTSVRDNQSRYKKEEFFSPEGKGLKWRGEVISNLNNVVNVVVVLEKRKIPERYEAVVIGSGFGGTITSLTLANKYEMDGEDKEKSLKRRVCILERGQWWVSHEMPTPDAANKGTIDGEPTLRGYLTKNDMPYGTWAYPDNTKGLLNLFGNSRPINNLKGVYDYKAMRNVHIISASGVGGGSLVYTNVTEEPDSSVYQDWATQNDGKPPLSPEYFEMASRFIGVNSITTTAGIGKFLLPRASAFQNATKSATVKENLMNLDSLDAKLSITDIPDTRVLFSKVGPLELNNSIEKMTPE